MNKLIPKNNELIRSILLDRSFLIINFAKENPPTKVINIAWKSINRNCPKLIFSYTILIKLKNKNIKGIAPKVIGIIPNVLSSLKIFTIIKILYNKKDTEAINIMFNSDEIKNKLASQLNNNAIIYKLETFFDVKRYKTIKIGRSAGLINHCRGILFIYSAYISINEVKKKVIVIYNLKDDLFFNTKRVELLDIFKNELMHYFLLKAYT